MNDPTPGRNPRSKARRAQTTARIGGALPPEPRPPADEPPRPSQASPAAPPQAFPWEDTGTAPDLTGELSMLRRQPPWFWAVLALLLTALVAVLAVIGINAWRDLEAKRAEERMQREWAEEEAKYKFPYRESIETHAARNGVDPALVAAMIYHESRFQPDAVSSVGARGLMQIMKDTGEWIAMRLDETSGYTQDSLFDPETSIRYGIWYLGYLSDLFDGDMVKMAAGYHAGQNNVLAWLKNPDCSADGVKLEKIPTADTDQYVKRVVDAYAIYVKHYYAPTVQEAIPAA